MTALKRTEEERNDDWLDVVVQTAIRCMSVVNEDGIDLVRGEARTAIIRGRILADALRAQKLI